MAKKTPPHAVLSKYPDGNHGGGGYAKRHGENRKITKKYDIRILDYTKMVAGQGGMESGPRKRMAGGGYHKPGSMQK